MNKKHINKKRKGKWSKIRAKGRKRYILVNGILIIGGSFAILSYLIRMLLGILEAYWFNTPYKYTKADSIQVVIILGVFNAVFFGWLMGSTTWSRNEKAYRESEDD